MPRNIKLIATARVRSHRHRDANSTRGCVTALTRELWRRCQDNASATLRNRNVWNADLHGSVYATVSNPGAGEGWTYRKVVEAHDLDSP